MDNRPKVGLGVMIKKDNKFLLGKRKNAHNEGSWCFPGGHLEFGESWEECARRETREEAGIEIKNVKLTIVNNDISKIEHTHYVTICMEAEYSSGEAKVMEPDKFECWNWFEQDKLPTPLYISTQAFINNGLRH